MHEIPSLTRLFKSLREERREHVIEDLLFDYPYLISEELASPKRQVRLDKDSRGDLLFYLGNKLVIVEIKRGKIDAPAVKQICRYLKRCQSQHKRVQGFLVGNEITPIAKGLIAKAAWTIKFRALGRDVPTEIVICRQCRRARDHRVQCCPRDQSVELL